MKHETAARSCGGRKIKHTKPPARHCEEARSANEAIHTENKERNLKTKKVKKMNKIKN